MGKRCLVWFSVATALALWGAVPSALAVDAKPIVDDPPIHGDGPPNWSLGTGDPDDPVESCYSTARSVPGQAPAIGTPREDEGSRLIITWILWIVRFGWVRP
jgi:hypothetical protein